MVNIPIAIISVIIFIMAVLIFSLLSTFGIKAKIAADSKSLAVKITLTWKRWQIFTWRRNFPYKALIEKTLLEKKIASLKARKISRKAYPLLFFSLVKWRQAEIKIAAPPELQPKLWTWGGMANILISIALPKLHGALKITPLTKEDFSVSFECIFCFKIGKIIIELSKAIIRRRRKNGKSNERLNADSFRKYSQYG